MRTKGILTAITSFFSGLRHANVLGNDSGSMMRETEKHAQRDSLPAKVFATSGAFGSVKRAGRKLSRKIGRGFDVRAFRNATA